MVKIRTMTYFPCILIRSIFKTANISEISLKFASKLANQKFKKKKLKRKVNIILNQKSLFLVMIILKIFQIYLIFQIKKIQTLKLKMILIKRISQIVMIKLLLKVLMLMLKNKKIKINIEVKIKVKEKE